MMFTIYIDSSVLLFFFSFAQSERAQSEKPVEKYASTNGDDNMINAAG